MKKILQIACVFLLIACGNKKEKNPQEPKTPTKQETAAVPVDKLVKRIEYVHQKDSFAAKGMVQFHLSLQMEGKETLEETIRIATENLAMRIDRYNGQSFYFEGQKTYVSSKEDNTNSPKFLVHASLFALPFVLKSPGSQTLASEIVTEKYESLKLILDKNIAIFPSSTYIVFADNRTDLIKAVVYTEQSEGEKFTISFENYITVKDIPIATTWKIFEWKENGELFGKLLGKAKISQISFSPFSKEIFEVPQDAEEIDDSSNPPIG